MYLFFKQCFTKPDGVVLQITSFQPSLRPRVPIKRNLKTARHLGCHVTDSGICHVPVEVKRIAILETVCLL